MQWPDPPEGYELIGEFVDIQLSACIVGSTESIQFGVMVEVIPDTRAQDSADVIAAVSTSMLLVWYSAWEKRTGDSLCVEFRSLNQVCRLTSDERELPLDAVTDAARDLVREP